MTIGKVGAKRLLRLAKLLESEHIDAKKFDLSTWSARVSDTQHDCGFAACAIGWATTIPEFARAGLHLKVEGNNAFPTLKGKDSSPRLAVSQFFGISVLTVERLFTAVGYASELVENITAPMVAKQIRRQLECNEW